MADLVFSDQRKKKSNIQSVHMLTGMEAQYKIVSIKFKYTFL